jgi:predicted nuclease of predicted toxin-antitoxin system
MKLLFDENLSFKLCDRLAKLFPGSSQVRLLGLAEASDRTIWDYAGRNGFTLVSLDVDFADRATLLCSARRRKSSGFAAAISRRNG